MLSNSVIKNVGQSSHYYSQQDNYYTRDEGIEQSEWWGNGAEKLTLSGQVDTKQFTDLLSGKMPDGEQLGKVVDGKISHRPGWDLTFSAPKSVSIMALIAGDKRLINAHREAVNVALSSVEKSCAQARNKTNGEMQYQNTNNIVGALYHHDLSRAQDPQLHTHSVIMNMTQRSDGKWRSLASSMGRYNEEVTGQVNGFIERLRHHNRYFSKLYETELAYRVKELGYEIKTNPATGIFEIDAVPQELIDQFSKRRQEIESSLKDKGLSGGKAAEFASLSTRERKELIDRDELHSKWLEEIKNSNVDLDKILFASRENNHPPISTEEVICDKAHTLIKGSAKELSVFQSTFTLEELVMQASSESIARHVPVNALLQAAKSGIETGNLISLANEHGKTVLMAKSTLEDESKLIENLKDNKTSHRLISGIRIDNYLSEHQEVNSNLSDSLKDIFSEDRVMVIEGNQNKKNLITPIMQLCASENKDLAVLSPSLVGSYQLAKSMKPDPQGIWEHIKAMFVDNIPKYYSVMQFLSNANNERSLPNVLLVENAHLLSTHQKSELISWNKQHNTKLILFGETNKLLSQQVGSSITELTRHGIKTISAIEPKIDLHHTLKNEDIISVEKQDDRFRSMSSHFCRLHSSERQKSWVATYSKSNAKLLNDTIHYKLKENGDISKPMSFNKLTPIFLPHEKSTLAESYKMNQVVRFNENYTSLKINRGEYLRVSRTSKLSNRVILQKENGERVIWRPDKVAAANGKIEVFTEEKTEIGIGENVILSRSIKMQNAVKGERYQIQKISGEKIKLVNQNGKSVILDLNKSSHRHFDYGYATTLHSIAHERPETIIADLPARSFQTDQRRINQLLTQSKHVHIYTDDTHKLVKKLDKYTGDKLSAHEILSRADDIKKNLNAIYDLLQTQVETTGNGKSNSSRRIAIDAIQYAMRHLTEREAGFTHKDLMHSAMKYAIGNVNEKMLNEVTIAMEKSGILLRGSRNDGTLWTTAEAVKIEREIIALAREDKGKMLPIANKDTIDKYGAGEKLTSEQILAIKTILGSEDRVLSIQGRAGVGKTTMMISLESVLLAKTIVTDTGYTLYGIAPTNKAVKELADRGIQSQTIDSFLVDRRHIQEKTGQPSFEKTILIIDEASMVSNQKMLSVLKVVHEEKWCRGIPTGDIHQNPSIEAGKPQDLVQRSLESVIELKDIQRQKNPELKEAVLALYKGDFKKTFSILNKNIIEIQGNNDRKEEAYANRIAAIVKDYFLAVEKGENVQIITPGHRDRKLVNSAIRQEYIARANLHGTSVTANVLIAKDMTAAEKSHSKNYKVGQIIKFVTSSGEHIKSGEYFTLTQIDTKQNILTLSKTGGDGIPLIWEIPKSTNSIKTVEVFERETRDLQVGDKVVWTKTNKKEGFTSANIMDVVEIDKNNMSVKQQDGKILTVDYSNPKSQHWDHAYALTTYSTQGGTYSTVIGLFESYQKNLMNLKNFLVTITRAVNNLIIYTDNKAELEYKISSNAGNKTSSLEVIGEYPKKQEATRQPNKAIKVESTKQHHEAHYDRITADRIIAGLNQDAEKIAIDILGNPKLRGSNFLKFGQNQGSLSVTIKGERQGWWHDFSEGKGGRTMLSFIQYHNQLTKKEALDYGAKWVGAVSPNHQSPVNKSSHNEKQNEYKIDPKKVAYARKLAEQSLPIIGTLAERYLKEIRGIHLKNYPDDIRFHPGVYSKLNGKAYPAMLVVARDSKGKITAVQATYLDSKSASKVDKSTVTVQKQTFGSMRASAVTVKGAKDAPTLIAEGVETGLSLKQALPDAAINITLSKANFKNIDPQSLSGKVVFTLDYDGKDLKQDKTIRDATKRLIDANKHVSFMVPNHAPHQKLDYNDILKDKGIGSIKQDFKQAISATNFYGEMMGANKMEAEKISRMANNLAVSEAQQNKAQLTAFKTEIIKSQQPTTITIPNKLNDVERSI